MSSDTVGPGEEFTLTMDAIIRSSGEWHGAATLVGCEGAGGADGVLLQLAAGFDGKAYLLVTPGTYGIHASSPQGGTAQFEADVNYYEPTTLGSPARDLAFELPEGISAKVVRVSRTAGSSAGHFAGRVVIELSCAPNIRLPVTGQIWLRGGDTRAPIRVEAAP